jgi:hypothetical protein
MAGSQYARTEVTPASLSWATMFDAWLGNDTRSSLYFWFVTTSIPALRRRSISTLTDSWYSAFSGAMMPKRLGWSRRAGPACSARDPGGYRPMTADELAAATLLPSENRLQA